MVDYNEILQRVLADSGIAAGPAGPKVEPNAANTPSIILGPADIVQLVDQRSHEMGAPTFALAELDGNWVDRVPLGDPEALSKASNWVRLKTAQAQKEYPEWFGMPAPADRMERELAREREHARERGWSIDDIADQTPGY